MNDLIRILSLIYFILAGFIGFNEWMKIRDKIGITMKEDIPWNK